MTKTTVTIFHNPRCSKSREALGYLSETNCEIEQVEYLKTGLTKTQLIDLLQRLNVPAHAIIRTSEPIYKSNYAGKDLSESEWIDAMVLHPILIERPIVIYGNTAIIGRPPVLVKELIPTK